MKKKPFGCLTTSGLITAILTVAVVVGVGWMRGGILFIPGALNAQAGATLGGVSSHADLSSKCSACHVAFWQTASMADNCVACHTDVAAQQKDPSKLHGDLLKKNPGMTCKTCHPDHRGPDASLTDLPNIIISHNVFKFALTAHQKQTDGSAFDCKTCHVNGYPKFDQTVCSTCHQQIKADFMKSHIQAYSETCLSCHDGIDTYGHNFDHSTVAFQLTGKHAQVDCGSCHTGARTIADLKATSTNCYACHAKNDAHNGQLGTNCNDCHATSGWLPATFNHDLTAFPLTGQHVQVPCTSCHVNNVFKGTPTDCYSCHAKKDAHQGQFGTSCELCHITTGWLPSTFDHNMTAFKLTGKHVQAACLSCHINNVFKGTPTDCYSCHASNDAHKGQFGTSCELCHTTNGWLPANFNHSGFPLTGGHAGLACTQCHRNNVFLGLSTACSACHADPAFHAGLFASTPCSQCHNINAWTPATYNGPHPGGCDGNCIHHGGASCRDCHTVNLMTATCTKCHDSNNPGSN
jgi:hypothetical protein